jgi:MFS family permease
VLIFHNVEIRQSWDHSRLEKLTSTSGSTPMQPVSYSLEDAFERNPTGLFQYRLFAICGLAFMTDSLGVNLLSFLTTCAAAEWELTRASQALLTSIVFVGIILGSVFWGRFADEFGRKRTLLYSCLLVTIGGFGSALSPSYVFLVLFRAVAGFGIGGASVPFDLLAEFLPNKSRSIFLVLMGIFWTSGAMFVAGVAWGVLPVLGWRYLAFITTVPVLLTTAIAYIHLPESPRWLLSKDREAEAIRIVRDAALINGVVMPEFRFSASTPDVSEDAMDGSYWELVRTPASRQITLSLWAIWAAFGFSYYGIILFVSRVYSNQDNITASGVPTCEFNYAAIFYNAAAEVVSVFISAALIERLGRRWSQSAFYALGGVAVACMGFKQQSGALLFFSLMARMCVNSGLVSISGELTILCCALY